MGAGTSRPFQRKAILIGALLVLLLLALLVPPYISLNGYRRQMISSISQSLGRPVHIDEMHLRLLPTPGIAMSGFEVEEDPAFGSEPALRAASVVATLRVSSLWRRPFEVSSISMDEPSLNLVHNANGRWNIDSILLQAARGVQAPTAQAHHGRAARFPYIELTDGRINVKSGLEKRPFSLFNADLAIWQESPNQWRLRLKAQPVRTDLDLDLSDTGTVRLEGSLGRTTNLDSMPIHLDGSWRDAQLGQVSRLLLGADEGWRGDLGLTTSLRGTLHDLDLQWRVQIANAHRQEFTPVTTQNFDARCQAQYHTDGHSLDHLLCLLPTPPGHLLLTGSIAGLEHPVPSLQLEVNQVPAAFLIQSLGLVRQRAGSIEASGALNGEFTDQPVSPEPAPTPGTSSAAVKNPAPQSAATVPGWSGQAAFDKLTLQLDGLDQPIVIPHLAVTLGAQPAVAATTARHTAHRARTRKPMTAAAPQALGFNLQPASLNFGGAAPLTVRGRLDRDGFHLQLAGAAGIADLLALHRQLGGLPPALDLLAPQGTAELNLALSGAWLAPLTGMPGAPSTTATGTLQLAKAVVHPGFLTEPATITAATLTLAPDSITGNLGENVSWESAAFTVGALQGHLSATPAGPCLAPAPCAAHFTLDLPKADSAQLLAAFTGADAHGVLWQDLLAHLDRGHREWPDATGAIRIGTLTAGPLALRQVLASVTVSGTHLQIGSLDAAALGGKLHAQGTVDASGDAPVWHLALDGQSIAVPQLASLFHEQWGTGSGNLQVRFTAQGWEAAALADSATGVFHWAWNDGSLGSDAPLGQFSRWTASGRVAHQQLSLTSSTLDADPSATPLPVRGTIGFDRQIHLEVGAPAAATSVSGTLAKPASTSAVAEKQ
jgi:uncharacterized protein involved in outer membrane biogenesis